MPKTFEQFIRAESNPPEPKQANASPLRQWISNQMIRAKIIPASASDQQPSSTDTAKSLSDQVLEMHAKIIRDGSANMNERRMSYQAVCLSLLMMLTLRDTPDGEEE